MMLWVVAKRPGATAQRPQTRVHTDSVVVGLQTDVDEPFDAFLSTVIFNLQSTPRQLRPVASQRRRWLSGLWSLSSARPASRLGLDASREPVIEGSHGGSLHVFLGGLLYEITLTRESARHHGHSICLQSQTPELQSIGDRTMQCSCMWAHALFSTCPTAVFTPPGSARTSNAFWWLSATKKLINGPVTPCGLLLV